MNKSNIILAVYGLIGIANLVGNVLDMSELSQYSKSLLMPVLLLYLYESSKGAVTLKTLIAGGALIFSWGGDLFLINPDYFLQGLGCFFIAQSLYIVAFRKATYGPVYFSLKFVIPIALVGVVVLLYLIPSADGFEIPIILYSLVILGMLAAALGRSGLTLDNSFKLAATGAALFVISDLTIAVNKFVIEIPAANFWIMLTYISAQFLIVQGLIKHTD